MANSFYLVWSQNGSLLRGFDTTQQIWVDGQLSYPVAFPGQYSETEIITLRSSARESGTLESLTNVKLFLTGNAADVLAVQQTWTGYGNAFSPARPEMNGGIEISFDQGQTYVRFDATLGLESDPTTWMIVPGAAIGLGAVDGTLGPFDEAKFYVRYRVPPSAVNYKLLDVRLGVSCDIL